MKTVKASTAAWLWLGGHEEAAPDRSQESGVDEKYRLVE